MIASLLLMASLAQPAAPAGHPETSSFAVSLHIVAACDPRAAPVVPCDEKDYERWLREHASRKITLDERGGQVVEVQY